MTKKLIILFLLSFSVLFSQNDHLKLSKDSDTLNFIKIRDRENKIFELPEINNTNNDTFRLQTSNFLLDINKTCGKVYYYAKEILENNDSVGIYKRTFNLNKKQINLLLNLIESTKIKEIPSDIYIEDWTTGIDGIVYTIEYIENDTLSFKKYWTPGFQQNVEYAKRIRNFILNVESIIESKKIIKKFNNKIPFKRWSWNGFGTNKKRAKIFE